MKFYLNDHKKIHILVVLLTIFLIAFGIFAQLKYAPIISETSEHKEVIRWNLQAVLQGDEYVFSNTLPDNLNSADGLVYYTNHKEISVDIDGKEVYSLRSGGGKMSTGYVWNFVTLSEKDCGKRIDIRVKKQEGEIVPSDVFYIGPEVDISNRILIKSIYMFVVGLLILIVGAAMMTVWIISNVRNLVSIGNGMSYFSSFAISLGLWTMAESKIIELVTSWHLLLMFIDHGALMMMPIMFILYTKETFTSFKIKYWKAVCCGGVGIIVIRLLLQVTSLMSLRNTLWMTQISIIVMGALAIYMVWHEYQTGRMTLELKISCVCLFLLLGAGLIELILFVMNVDYMGFGSTAFLIYVVANAIGNLLSANTMLRRAEENEIFRKMAISDVLTGLGNRLGFQHEFNSRTYYTSEDKSIAIEPTTIFMMDLNNLKLCNDEFGHDYGDWYITTSARAIESTFAGKGKAFRIGGDEFAAITSETDAECIEKLRKTILSKFEKSISDNKKCDLNIAIGIATYDANRDRLLSDTLKRADALMYENKLQIKEGKMKS